MLQGELRRTGLVGRVGVDALQGWLGGAAAVRHEDTRMAGGALWDGGKGLAYFFDPTQGKLTPFPFSINLRR